MNPGRRALAQATLGAAFGLLGTSLPGRADTAESTYPDRPVVMVVPFAANGSTHFVARMLSRRLTETLGQTFLLDVRTGMSGLNGMASVAQAPADGYTLLVSPNSSFAMAVHIEAAPFEVKRDFAPISLLASNALALCVHTGSGFRVLADLVEAARAAPRQVRYGSAGFGVTNHLAAELLAQGFGIELTAVRFNGGEPAVQALMHETVELSFVDMATAVPLIRGGALRALAVTSTHRAAQLPDVPTIAESGLPTYRATTDFGLFAAAGTPEAILRRLSEASMAAVQAEETRALLAPLAIEPIGSTRAGFASYVETETRRWQALVQQRGLQNS